MSETARWVYTNKAQVRPFLGIDMRTGARQYGAAYEIACTWTAESEQQRADDGAEFVSRRTIFTEDPRPKFLDLVLVEGGSEWEEVRSKTDWDMSFFGENPDYKLVT